MDVEHFIQRWTGREGGAERANYQMFLSELCDVLGVARPDPAGAERSHNDYVFERAVDSTLIETGSVKRIDLYKRGAFILEAKQSRLPGKKNAVPGQLSLLGDEPEQLGRRSVASLDGEPAEDRRDPSLAYARAARAVRMAIALQWRLLGELPALERAGPAPAGSPTS